MLLEIKTQTCFGGGVGWCGVGHSGPKSIEGRRKACRRSSSTTSSAGHSHVHGHCTHKLHVKVSDCNDSTRIDLSCADGSECETAQS
eukprot:scaffold787_cov285-Chaetoceros_neogracile.AAC.73